MSPEAMVDLAVGDRAFVCLVAGVQRPVAGKTHLDDDSTEHERRPVPIRRAAPAPPPQSLTVRPYDTVVTDRKAAPGGFVQKESSCPRQCEQPEPQPPA